MHKKNINTISSLITCIKENSTWQYGTICNVVQALGFNTEGGEESLKELSSQLVNCAEHGADSGFPGFCYYSETIAFYRKNRRDIVNNIEEMAAELGEDIIKMVQSFGVFRNAPPPTSGEIGKALWDSAHLYDELTALYNVFAWYALEEVSNIWYRYLEDNPGYYAELSA